MVTTEESHGLPWGFERHYISIQNIPMDRAVETQDADQLTSWRSGSCSAPKASFPGPVLQAGFGRGARHGQIGTRSDGFPHGTCSDPHRALSTGLRWRCGVPFGGPQPAGAAGSDQDERAREPKTERRGIHRRGQLVRGIGLRHPIVAWQVHGHQHEAQSLHCMLGAVRSAVFSSGSGAGLQAVLPGRRRDERQAGPPSRRRARAAANRRWKEEAAVRGATQSAWHPAREEKHPLHR